MSHELDFSTGRAAIAYRGEVPWHQYGFVMRENAPIEEWTREARVDFAVDRRPITTSDLDGNKISLPKFRALMRSDTQQVLSVVSDQYKVVQPREIAEFFRDLCGQHGYVIETMGALAGGRKVWALARTGQQFNLGIDQVKAYLLLATSYDRTFSTTGQFTGVRVVCNNTLSVSLSMGEHQSSGIIRVPHTATFDPNQVKVDLGILQPAWQRFGEMAELLSNIRVTKRQAVEFFMELMGYEDEGTKPIEEQAQDVRLVKKLLLSYETAPGQDLESAKDTAWGLVNAVTHFTDHTRRAHNNGTRLNSAWFGDSSVLKQKAVKQALELAEAA